MTKKKTELAFASVVLMILVLFVHSMSECYTGYNKDSVQFAATLLFHRLSHFPVQGFIFLSGLKLFLRRDKEFHLGKFYLGRLRRVIVPYVIVYLIFYLFFTVKKYISPSLGGFFYGMATGTLVSHFYFVVIICQFYLLMPLWRLIEKKASPILAVTASLIMMIIFMTYLPDLLKRFFGVDFSYNSHLFTNYIFYFVAGIFAGKFYEKFKAFLIARRRGIITLWAVVGVFDCASMWLIETKRVYIPSADMFHVMYCISAILALLSLAVKYAERERKTDRALMLVDKASYNVYLIHPLFIFISESLLSRIGVRSLSVRFIIKVIITYAVSILLCIGIEFLKEKIRSRQTHQKT